jgi:hypothetical protein
MDRQHLLIIKMMDGFFSSISNPEVISKLKVLGFFLSLYHFDDNIAYLGGMVEKDLLKHVSLKVPEI